MMKQLFVLMGLLWLVSTQSSQQSAPIQTKNQVAKRVSKEEFKKQLKELKDVQLIDVRTPAEFKKGSITGAVNMDYFGANFQQQILSLDKTKPVLIFCQSGGRSGKALAKMKTMGFSLILELEGGYGNWIRK